MAIILLGVLLPRPASAQTAAFVALSGTGTNAAYSYDGIHWYPSLYGSTLTYGCGNGFVSASETVAYGSGVFTALSPTGGNARLIPLTGFIGRPAPLACPILKDFGRG
jgi:hypothetical protein